MLLPIAFGNEPGSAALFGAPIGFVLFICNMPPAKLSGGPDGNGGI